MQDSKLERWLPVTGLLFVIGMIGVLILPMTPSNSATTQTVASFYTEHKNAMILASGIVAWSAVMLSFFAGSLRSYIAPSEPGQLMSSLVLAGGVLMAGGMMLAGTANFAAADTVGKIDPSQTRVLHVIGNEFFMPFIAGFGLFALSAAAAILRTRALPVAFGWVALLLGIVAVTPAGWPAFMCGLIWIAVVSILLLVRGGRPHAAGARTSGDAKAQSPRDDSAQEPPVAVT